LKHAPLAPLKENNLNLLQEIKKRNQNSGFVAPLVAPLKDNLTPTRVDDPPPPPDPPGADCEHCPACGTWDYREFSRKQLCFHRAYFIGRAGNPVDIEIQRRDCPLNNQQ
jgi:hypothetical protein